MNHRVRRHQHHNRRQSQASDHSLSQYHQYHNGNRPIYVGQLGDAYSANNRRNPSTTTTTTDRSSISQTQTSDGCSTSICYSYLVAIISSFLVVLGIYLSLTRFNINYLYISLVGLLFPAVGACIYCIGNIRSSKLARRKQWVNSEDFIFNSSTSPNNNNLAEVQSRQQQITTITNILSNQPQQTNNAAINETNNIINNENNSSAITNVNEPNHRASSSSESTQQIDITEDNSNHLSVELADAQDVGAQNQREDNVDSIICTSPSTNISASALQPINKSPCQQLPEATSGASLTTTSLLSNQDDSTSIFTGIPVDGEVAQMSKIAGKSDVNQTPVLGQLSINMVSQFNNSQLGDCDNKNKISPAKQSESSEGTNLALQQSALAKTQDQNQEDIKNSPLAVSSTFNQQPSESSNTTRDNNSMQTSSNVDHDLNNSTSPCSPGSSGSEQISSVENGLERGQVAPNKRKNQQRLANFRRTLVMGISGEEEVVEIDEEDLENMSIVPPSYDSIANTSSQPKS